MMSLQSREANSGDGPWSIGDLLPEVLAALFGEPVDQATSTGYIDFPNLASQPLMAELMSVV